MMYTTITNVYYIFWHYALSSLMTSQTCAPGLSDGGAKCTYYNLVSGDCNGQWCLGPLVIPGVYGILRIYIPEVYGLLRIYIPGVYGLFSFSPMMSPFLVFSYVTPIPMTSQRFPWRHNGSHDVTPIPMTSQRFPWRHNGSHDVTTVPMTSQRFPWRHAGSQRFRYTTLTPSLTLLLWRH